MVELLGQMIKATSDDIKAIANYVHEISGVFLDESKGYLIEARLSALAEGLGCRSYHELIKKAKSDSNKSIERKIIDAITTNETLFFRDTSPFDLLKHKILPEVIDKQKAMGSQGAPLPVRIWSAACSTGQEVYSIAIVLKELIPDLRKFNIRLLGTDISDAAIAQASYGQYNKFEMGRGLSQDKMGKYFESNGNGWKVKDDLRALVSFKKLNLMGPFTGLGKFHVVFCRNVAIYFKRADRKELFNKIANVLDSEGYLITGAAESLMGVCSRFEPKRYLKSQFYQLVG